MFTTFIFTIGIAGLIICSIFAFIHFISDWDNLVSENSLFIVIAWSFFFGLAAFGSYEMPNKPPESAIAMARAHYKHCIDNQYNNEIPVKVHSKQDYCLVRSDNFYKVLTMEGRRGLKLNPKDIKVKNETNTKGN